MSRSAGHVVEAAAVTDADLLVDRDLDMVDMVAIPDRLEHAVGKAQHQDVLDGFLAEIMVDPVDLVLVDDLQEFAVELPRRGKVGTERFFDHQPPPGTVFRQHAGAAELAADRQERVRRRRQIKQPVAAGLPRGFQLVELLVHRIERGRVFRIGLDAGDACQQALGDGVVHRAGGVPVQSLHQAVAQFAARHALAGNADHAEFIRQQVVGSEVIKGGDYQPVREVSGDAEDHERAGIGPGLCCLTDRHASRL